ncbi:MAG: M55 family metallopeptidase [Acidobacteriia bacterium]|nr:M55 family metallopeptidase [Terriglobia bacterium]
MKRIVHVLAVVALLTLSVNAQVKKLKVYISADMEGVAGVSTWNVQGLPPGREYEQFRHLMTNEVNAAIQGAYDAGASEVLVSDGHGDGQNIDVEKLDPRARLIRAWPRPLQMMQGIDGTFDAVVFIGYHAGEGEADAVLAHTFSGKETIKLNGQPVPEAGFNAAIAGEFGVPVVFVSGDQTIVTDAKRMFGNIEGAVVKQATGFASATMLSPEESRRLIREGVKQGIDRRKEIAAFKLSHPIKLEITFKDIVMAEVASYLPGVERVNGNTILFTGRDMIEVSRFHSAVANIRP